MMRHVFSFKYLTDLSWGLLSVTFQTFIGCRGPRRCSRFQGSKRYFRFQGPRRCSRFQGPKRCSKTQIDIQSSLPGTPFCIPCINTPAFQSLVNTCTCKHWLTEPDDFNFLKNVHSFKVGKSFVTKREFYLKGSRLKSCDISWHVPTNFFFLQNSQIVNVAVRKGQDTYIYYKGKVQKKI